MEGTRGQRKRVVVVGVGFGGLHAARALAGENLDVILVDRQNYHLFQPLLYQVATAAIEQESIAYPARALTRQWNNASFRLAEVEEIDLEGRALRTTDGAICYDYLVVAAGSVTNFFGMHSVERHGFDLKSLDHAVQLRSHLLRCFEEAAQEPDPEKRRGLLTFVIVGGGPTGVEFAGALAELVYNVLVGDYPDLPVRESRIVLVEAAGGILTAFPPRLQEYSAERLGRLGVEVLLHTKVVDAEPGKVHLEGNRVIAAATLFWSSGVKAAPLADQFTAPKGPQGRVPVNPDLSLPGHPEVFVVGDMAHVEQDGKPLPMLAPVAMQGGAYAGRAILARESGATPEPFRYRNRGTMATIGKNAAVALVQNRPFSGYPAWVLWLGLHLYYLIGFRNRMLVLANWSYYYFSDQRQLRLITGEPRS